MEFKPNRANDRSAPRRVIVPTRGRSEQPPTLFTQAPKPQDLPLPQKKMTAEELIHIREDLGFDDIPVDQLDDRSMKEIFLAWSKQRLDSGAPGKKQRVKRLISGKKFRDWKDDLKWALQADLEDTEDSKPTAKNEPPSPRTSISMSTPEHKPQNNSLTPPVPTLRPKLSDKQSEPAPKSVEININFGSLPKLPKLTLLSKLKTGTEKIKHIKWTRRRGIIAGIVVISLLLFLAVPKLMPIFTHRDSTKGSQTAKTTAVAQKPDYTTVLPQDKTIDALGGWKRVSPPDRAPVFAYADSLDGIAINVSQQTLPDSFQPDVDEQVAELAKSFSATDKIDADGTKVYVGTSAKGPQSVILVKNNTLILIKSQAKISDDSWTAYAKSLK